MNREDLARVPLADEPWLAFLEGKNPAYPIEAMKADFEHIRERVEFMGNDPTSADTRLADYLLRVVPPATDTLTQLTVGGYFPRGRIWVLHSRVRYFDPDRRRAGLPPDVAALVHELKDDAVTVTLVNLNQVEPRNLVVQAGAYAEHLFTEADGSALTVRLAPGAGKKLTLKMKRYVNRPTLAFPWNR